MTAALTALAIVIPAMVYFALRPRRSVRGAQVRSAIIILASAVQLGGAVYFQSVGDNRPFGVFMLGGVASAILAGSVLLQNRQLHDPR